MKRTEEKIDPSIMATERIGLVLWLPRDLVQEILYGVQDCEEHGRAP